MKESIDNLCSNEVYLIEPGTEVTIHPFATALPRLESEVFEALKESIKSNGQKNPVIMHGDILLDGLNRLEVCKALDIPVKAVQWDGQGTPEDLIIALNLDRRHLTASQRAAFGVQLLPELEQQAAERRGTRTDIREKVLSGGKAVDIAGAKVGVSGKYVARAKQVADASAETYQKLLNGSVKLAQAVKEVKAAVAEPQPDQPVSPRYSLFESIREIILLVDVGFYDKLCEIAAVSPRVIGKALDTCYEHPDAGEDAEAEQTEEFDVGYDVATGDDEQTEQVVNDELPDEEAEQVNEDSEVVVGDDGRVQPVFGL
jgi:hypothetical protein